MGIHSYINGGNFNDGKVQYNLAWPIYFEYLKLNIVKIMKSDLGKIFVKGTVPRKSVQVFDMG
jgi:hypothetical protein